MEFWEEDKRHINCRVQNADSWRNFQRETALGSPENYRNIEKILGEERSRILEVLMKEKMRYQRFDISIRDKQFVVNFQIPSTCHIHNLLADIVMHLGLKEKEDRFGSRMILRSCNSSNVLELTLSDQEQQDINQTREVIQEDNHEGALRIFMYESPATSENTEIEFVKQGRFSSKEVEAVASILKIISIKKKINICERKMLDSCSLEKSVAKLEAMGVRVFGLDETFGVSASGGRISWDNVAGYEAQKREIEDTIVLALKNPGVYATIAHGTRTTFESNRPRAVLFEGPSGTGKTSCARVIASQAGIPLLYVPLELVMPKWYGESENLLGEVFFLADELPDGALIFLDDVDSLATDLDSEMQEANRRLLSVLLREIDDFEQDAKVIVIGATNRKEDLDPALIRRFDSMITFGLPDKETREKIISQYAKHLTKSELSQLAAATHAMSGRDIKDVCEKAERRWASKIIRGGVDDLKLGDLPHIGEYLDSAEVRRKAMSEVAIKRAMRWSSHSRIKRQHLVD